MPERNSYAGPGEWIRAGLGSAQRGLVASVVPPVFAAYARLLHPFASRVGDSGELAWREVAADTDLRIGPGTSFLAVALAGDLRSPPGPLVLAPSQGSLPASCIGPLTRVLGSLSAEPEDCRFGLWDGYGWATEASLSVLLPAGAGHRPGLEAPGRDYIVFRGGLDQPARLEAGARQTPNLWWSSDRSWLVATDIDLESTYIGGSRDLVEVLRGEPGLEVLAVSPGDPLVDDLEGPVADRLRAAVETVVGGGRARVRTRYGTVEGWLEGGQQGRMRTRYVSALSPHRGDSSAAAGETAVERSVELALRVALEALIRN